MLIDTHCHLDASEFDEDRATVLCEARQAGVVALVLPAIKPSHFARLEALAHEGVGGYALGCHPLEVLHLDKTALETLSTTVEARLQDPRLVAIGEIGLDFFVSHTPSQQQWQEHFFSQQAKLAMHHDLPLLIHARGSMDAALAILGKIKRTPQSWKGIFHAFNGSVQQAKQVIDMGFHLGIGGAATYPRAQHLRTLLTKIPLTAWVLETDAPDMPPAWLYTTQAERTLGILPKRNAPKELARVAQEIAAFLDIPVDAWINITGQNSCNALPKLGFLLTPSIASS